MTGRQQAQSYHPYRRTLLAPEQLAAMNRLQSAIPVFDTLVLWAQIVACWLVVSRFPSVLTMVLAIPFIGTRYYALYIIGHDGLHRRLFASRRINDLWNDIFLIGPIGGVTRLNRRNHMAHHHLLALPEDPDRYKYADRTALSPVRFLLSMTGLGFVFTSFRNVFLAVPTGKAGRHDMPRYRLAELATVLGWQAMLVVGLTVLFGWWGYLLLWLAPVYMFTYGADMARVFLEHAVLPPGPVEDYRLRLVSYEGSFLERIVLAPKNMNFHAIHHLWPSIPYYNLPKANKLTYQNPLAENLVWRHSYLAFLRDYWSWVRLQYAAR